jgi:hypothetical protein
MDEIISYKMCAVKVRNAKLRNYLNHSEYEVDAWVDWRQVLKSAQIKKWTKSLKRPTQN